MYVLFLQLCAVSQHICPKFTHNVYRFPQQLTLSQSPSSLSPSLTHCRLKPVCFTNPFLYSLSGSIWTTFMEFRLRLDLLFSFFCYVTVLWLCVLSTLNSLSVVLCRIVNCMYVAGQPVYLCVDEGATCLVAGRCSGVCWLSAAAAYAGALSAHVTSRSEVAGRQGSLHHYLVSCHVHWCCLTSDESIVSTWTCT